MSTIGLVQQSAIAPAQQMSLFGLTLVRGSGVHVWDSVGNRYIDCLSAASSVPLGYNDQVSLAAFIAQCELIPQTCSVYSRCTPAENLAANLCISSGIEGAQVLFGLSGSDAIEAALKATFQYTGQSEVICFNRSYHGGTTIGLHASGFEKLRLGSSYPINFVHFPFPEESNWRVVLENIKVRLRTGKVSAVLMETILGDGGCIAPPDEFMQELSRLLKLRGALLILDEIQCGMGRTGKLWAYEHYNILPDVMCTGKALGGGYVPISACIGRKEIMSSLIPAQHAFTFAGHAASCAVAQSVLMRVQLPEVLNNVRRLRSVLETYMDHKLGRQASYSHVSGIGFMLGLQLRSTKSIGPILAKLALKRGVLVGYYGANNNVLRFHPHLNINEKDFVEAMQGVAETVIEFDQRGCEDVEMMALSAFS